MADEKITRREAIGKFKKAAVYLPPVVAILASSEESSAQTRKRPKGPPTEAKRARKKRPKGPPTEAKKKIKKKVKKRRPRR